MARPLRIEFSGALYHITSRGDRREAIYEDDEDREMFLGVLVEVVERYNWICHAFCLMTWIRLDSGHGAVIGRWWENLPFQNGWRLTAC